MFRFLCLLSLVCAVPIAQAKQFRVSPKDDWFGTLTGDQLRPGDELVLHAGIYSDPRRLVIRLRGENEKPIVIRSAEGESVIFRRPDAKQNTLNLEGSQHLTLRGIEIIGGAAGIRIGPRQDVQSNHVVLEDLHIHHIGGVAVTCNFEGASYHTMIFRRNHIHHTAGHGEAFYLGANHGKATLSNSLIQDNYIHHLNGPSVSQGDGIEIKQGSFGNRISGNVIHDTNYPAITVYGTAGNDRNVITDNLIWNSGDHGIQSAADAIVHGNYISNTAGCGIYSREHQGTVPGNLTIKNNFVIAKSDPAIRVIGKQSASKAIELVGNTLMGASNQIVVRLEGLQSVTATENRGCGAIVGPREMTESWSKIDRAKATLPKLEHHPAKALLPRNELQLRFTIE